MITAILISGPVSRFAAIVLVLASAGLPARAMDRARRSAGAGASAPVEPCPGMDHRDLGAALRAWLDALDDDLREQD